MLYQLLWKCRCRENFNEASNWVVYPQAIKWATEDFEQTGVDSWIIQYPLAGFCQFIQWLRIFKLESSPVEFSLDIPRLMLKTKLIHLLVTTMMANLLGDKAKDGAWMDPFLAILYFRPVVPGTSQFKKRVSIVNPELFWRRLVVALGQDLDVNRFLTFFSSSLRLEVTQHIQLIVPWFLSNGGNQTSTEEFFLNARLNEPLGAAALTPKAPLPEFALRNMLPSIFGYQPHSRRPCHLRDFNVPFVSPYGPSVLQCGEPSCRIKFYSELDLTSVQPSALRKRRTEHLKEAYGTSAELHAENTLPWRKSTPIHPTSTNYNLHKSIAFVWSRLNRTVDSSPPLAPSFAPFRHVQAFLPSKEEILKGDTEALTMFVDEVHFQICGHDARGDIFQEVETKIRQVLPSFWNALRVASAKFELAQYGDDGSGVTFVHDWTGGSMFEARIGYELSLACMWERVLALED